jgi:hypothetical protein
MSQQKTKQQPGCVGSSVGKDGLRVERDVSDTFSAKMNGKTHTPTCVTFGNARVLSKKRSVTVSQNPDEKGRNKHYA